MRHYLVATFVAALACSTSGGEPPLATPPTPTKGLLDKVVPESWRKLVPGSENNCEPTIVDDRDRRDAVIAATTALIEMKLFHQATLLCVDTANTTTDQYVVDQLKTAKLDVLPASTCRERRVFEVHARDHPEQLPPVTIVSHCAVGAPDGIAVRVTYYRTSLSMAVVDFLLRRDEKNEFVVIDRQVRMRS